MLDNDQLKDILSKSGARIYFVGIGGIAMSAAACIAKESDFEVTGSDSKQIYSPAKEVLEKSKIPVCYGYSVENLKNNPADLYILSAGESMDNPEVKFIEENNLPRARVCRAAL